MDADLVLLAMGFTGPVKQGMIEQLGVELDARGNIATEGKLHDFRAWNFCGGRYAARPIAGRLGDRRRPQSRRRCRRVSPLQTLGTFSFPEVSPRQQVFLLA